MILLVLILPLVISIVCSILVYRWIRRFCRATDDALEVLSDAR